MSSASPPARMRHQQLKQQLRALQTTFHTYTATPTPQTLAALLPALQQQLSQLSNSSSHLGPPLLLPALPTLLDLLDALTDLPLARSEPLVLDALPVLLSWAKGAERWLSGADDKHSAVYAEIAERVRDGYARLGSSAEQWAAAATLATSTGSTSARLLPGLLTVLALSLPYLSPAPRDSSLDLLLSSLHSAATCGVLLASPHLVDLLTALPASMGSVAPSRLLTVTAAVLLLWRRGGVSELRRYDEYKAVMAYTAGVGALARKDATTATQLQQQCSACLASATSNNSLLLFAVFAILGLLHTLDPRAAVYKSLQQEAARTLDTQTDTSSASSSSKSIAPAHGKAASSSADSAASTSIHASTILALQSSYQSAVDLLVASCSAPTNSTSTMTAPQFAASESGIVSAACVSGVDWLRWSDALFTFVTTSFLNLVDTRWCSASSAFNTASLSSPPPASRSDAASEWTRSSFFALLPQYSRAFSILFLRAHAIETQCQALARVRDRMRGVHRQWQQHNRGSHSANVTRQAGTTAMEEDGTERVYEPSDETDADDDSFSSTFAPAYAPSAVQPPVDTRTLSELQKTLFLSVCMALATVCKPALLAATPASAVCDVADTMAWLEFVRVDFSAYSDLVVAVVNEGVRRGAATQQRGSTTVRAGPGRRLSNEEKEPSWLSWLVGWRRHKQQSDRSQTAEGEQHQKSDPAHSSAELVHTFIHSHLSPSISPNTSAASTALASTASPLFPSSAFTPLILFDDSDLVSLSRHYFLLGLLSEWLDGLAAADAFSTLLPYSASFLHCPVRGVLKRAHGLFVRSLALIVRHHTLHSATSDTTDGYDVCVSVLLPYTRLALSQYPVQLSLPTLMDSFVLLFHLLPSDHPLLLDASHAIVQRLQQLTERAVAASLLSSSTAPRLIFGAGADSLQVPTTLRHLLILHFQLIQLLSLPSFRTVLGWTGELFPTAATPPPSPSDGNAGVYGGMLSVLREVIVRNFDLYRRDEAVRWWMAVMQRSGVVLAVPAPPPPLPIAAPSITTVQAKR